MKLIVLPTVQEAAEYGASFIRDAIVANPRLVLGLATGATMEPLYQHLCKLAPDCSQVTTFNLDEYVGLPAEDPNSYRYYMNKWLFNNLKFKSTNLPCGTAVDQKAECEKYEKMMAEAGGVDLQLLGVGNSGHIGFNDPPCDFNSLTHVEKLNDVTLAQNGPYFNPPESMPRYAYTMGIGTVMKAKKIIWVVTGAKKKDIFRKSYFGQISPDAPASILWKHPDVTAVIDKSVLE